jgi:hypothetical protein
MRTRLSSTFFFLKSSRAAKRNQAELALSGQKEKISIYRQLSMIA